jgi:hypothetical protein
MAAGRIIIAPESVIFSGHGRVVDRSVTIDRA